MEVVKHTDSSFVIKDDAKVASFSILGILLLISIVFLATISDLSFLGIITLILTGMYVIMGYLSRTYIFDKKENTFTVTEITFFRTQKKQYALDHIQSIMFVAMLPFTYGLYPNWITLARELAHHSGSVVHLKNGQKVSIIPSTYNMIQYLFRGDLVGLNESEAKVSQALSEFLHVPFEIKKELEKYPSKGPSKQFIKFLLKIVYALLIFLAIFIASILLLGLVNRLFNFF